MKPSRRLTPSHAPAGLRASHWVKSLLAALSFALVSSVSAKSVAAAPACALVFSSSNQGESSQAAPIERIGRLRTHGQRVWTNYDRWLRQRVRGAESPLRIQQFDADAIGRVHQEFARVFPHYHDYFRIDRSRRLSLEEYLPLRRQAQIDIVRVLRDRNATSTQLFAALEVTRVMSLIHGQVDFPPEQKDEEKDEQQQDEKQKQKDQDKKKDQQENDQPPEWPDMPDSYQPENKDISNDGSSGKSKNHDMVKTTIEARKNLLRAKVYDTVSAHSGQWSSIPLARPSANQTSVSAPQVIGHSKILVAGARRISMPLQYGVEPAAGNYHGFSIQEVYPQEFEIQIQDSSLQEIEVPLTHSRPATFQNGANVQQYTMASGLDPHLWPQELLDYLNSLKARHLTAIQTATELEKYLSKDAGYLYFSKGDRINEAELEKLKARLEQLKKQYPLPVALAHLKSFNCDGAATLTTILLRDFFQIPVRPVGGRTIGGKKKINGQYYYISQSNSPLHAWVEVWDGQAWIPFDMTPQLNNPEMNGDSSDLEQDHEEEREQDSSQSSQSSPSKSKDKKSEQKEKENKPDKDGKKEKKDKDKTESQDGDKSETPGEEKGDSSSSGSSDREINDTHQVRDRGGRQSGRSSTVSSPNDALEHALSAHLIENMLRQSDRRSVLNQAQAWSDQNKDNFHLKSVFQSVEARVRSLFHEHLSHLPAKTLSEVMTSVQRKLLNNDMTGAFTDLRAIRVAMEKLREHRSLLPEEEQFARGIDQFIARMKTYNHKDAKAFELAHRIVRSLPGKISYEWLQKKYGSGFLTLGDPALHAFARDLLNGQLRPLVLASILRDYARLVLNSEKVPTYKNEKTSQRATVMLKSDDLVVARSPLELPRMLLDPRPGQHLFAPLIEGRQFALGEQEVRRVPNPTHPIERKLSIVYYDISPSMDGLPLEIQDALLLAFVDIALSETDPFGRPTHEVIIVPFNDTILPAIEIHTREDALTFIANKIAMKSTTSGSTDIQKVLLHFYDRVAGAFKASEKEKNLARLLKRANLILFSDGGSTVDRTVVEEARKQIPALVKLYMNFIGIGNTNEELINLANASKTSSAQSLYRDLTTSLMTDASAEANLSIDADAFASNGRVPPELLSQFRDLANPPSFQTRGSSDVIHELSSHLAFTANASQNLSNPGLITALVALTTDVRKMDLPKSARVDFVSRLLENYPRMSGRALNSLTLTEKKSLDALVSWSLEMR